MHAYYLLTAYANVWILDTPLPSYYHVSHLDTDNGDGDRSPAPCVLLRELQIFGLRCTVMLPIVSISLLADLHTQSHAGVQVQAAR